MNLAARERAELCDLFDQVGPDAPTLCGEWRTADLAAHLYLRERRPDAAAGILLRPFAGYTERVQDQIRQGRSYTELVDAIRKGPPSLLRLDPVEQQINTVEYFVHHEDVRRGAGDLTPRPVDHDLERALWGRLKLMARLLVRPATGGVDLTAEGFGTVHARRGGDLVTASGRPGELVLFCFGRQAASQVELDGDAGAVQKLKVAKLGL